MIQLMVNGLVRQFDGDPEMLLLWYLRDELRLTGTKYGCGIGLCGRAPPGHRELQQCRGTGDGGRGPRPPHPRPVRDGCTNFRKFLVDPSEATCSPGLGGGKRTRPR